MPDLKLQLVRSPLPADSVDWRQKQFGAADGDRHMTVAEVRISESDADRLIEAVKAFNAASDTLTAELPDVAGSLASRFGAGLVGAAIPGEGRLRLLARIYPDD